jgi:hypothetical protein
MPLFASLFLAVFNKVFSFVAAYLGFKFALRLTVVLSLAALYIGGLTAFQNFVVPLVAALFSTSFGQVIGLAFPPIAGTVVTGLAALWISRLIFHYYEKLGGMLIK